MPRTEPPGKTPRKRAATPRRTPAPTGAKRNKPLPSDSQLQRERDALILRRVGHTYDTIAAMVGLSTKTDAYRYVQRALKRTLQEPADEYRALELDRLEALHQVAWITAMRGDLDAVDRVIRLPVADSLLRDA